MSLLKQKSPAAGVRGAGGVAGLGAAAPGQENIENSGGVPHVRAINFNSAETTPQPRGHKRLVRRCSDKVYYLTVTPRGHKRLLYWCSGKVY